MVRFRQRRADYPPQQRRCDQRYALRRWPQLSGRSDRDPCFRRNWGFGCVPTAFGGAWGRDGHLYVTSHDRTRGFKLGLPRSGYQLRLLETHDFPRRTRALIAWDPSFGAILFNDTTVARTRPPAVEMPRQAYCERLGLAPGRAGILAGSLHHDGPGGLPSYKPV